MRHTNKYTILFTLLLSAVIGCNNVSRTGDKKSDTLKAPSIEPYIVFLNKFYSDSIFQKERIEFPLKGERVGYFDTTKVYVPGMDHGYTWQKSNWQCLIKGRDTGLVDTIYFIKDTLVSGSFIRYSDFGMSSKFCVRNGKWYLVFHSEINL